MPKETWHKLIMPATDFTSANVIEVTISEDGTRIWVDVDGINRFRAYNVRIILVDDKRDEETPQ